MWIPPPTTKAAKLVHSRHIFSSIILILWENIAYGLPYLSFRTQGICWYYSIMIANLCHTDIYFLQREAVGGIYPSHRKSLLSTHHASVPVPSCFQEMTQTCCFCWTSPNIVWNGIVMWGKSNISVNLSNVATREEALYPLFSVASNTPTYALLTILSMKSAFLNMLFIVDLIHNWWSAGQLKNKQIAQTT